MINTTSTASFLTTKMSSAAAAAAAAGDNAASDGGDAVSTVVVNDNVENQELLNRTSVDFNLIETGRDCQVTSRISTSTSSSSSSSTLISPPQKLHRPQPLRLWSAAAATTSTLFFVLLFIIHSASPPVACDRFFSPRHVANVQPLASYLMSTFPGAFSSSSSGSSSLSSASSSAPPSASALTTSGLGVVSLLPVSLPYISTSSGGVNSFVAHSFGGSNNGGGLIGGGGECEYNGNAVMDVILDRMKAHLTEEKIVVQNGAITIYDASIVRFVELSRLRATCIRKLDPSGSLLAIPFEAEIRAPQVAARLKYNFYVTDIYGDYAGNFSHIRMNGTLEANLAEEYLTVADFNITDSRVVGDSIVFSYVPKWILDWVRSYFDSDNTELYQHLAKSILQREADSFRHFEMIREAMLIGEAQKEQQQQQQQMQHQTQQQQQQLLQQQLLQSLQNSPNGLLPTMQARGDTAGGSSGNGGDLGEDPRMMPLNRI